MNQNLIAHGLEAAPNDSPSRGSWTTLADGMKSLVRGDIGPVFARSVLFNPSFPFHHSLPAPGG